MTTATKVRERPILFSAPMVLAILSGSKTQTRRVVKLSRTIADGMEWYLHATNDGQVERSLVNTGTGEGSLHSYIRCPFGQPGDLLWVRETWTLENEGSPDPRIVFAADRRAQYLTFEGRVGVPAGSLVGQPFHLASDYAPPARWRPSIHMPKWAARIWLRVTDVRVERLQEITAEDAIAEGIERIGGDLSCTPWKNYQLAPGEPFAKNCASPIRSFHTLWDSINASRGYGWDANPWVWVVSFERTEAPAR